jgi:prepilin-type N-terminal cleavage/methylation domain-containing protein
VKTNRCSSRHEHERGFTLIELLVVVGIIGVLASLLLPVIARAKEAGQRAACKSNLKQIHLAIALYAEDNADWLPPKYEVKKGTLSAGDITNGKRLQTLPDGIHTTLASYIGSSSNTASGTLPRVFRCPSDAGSYANKTPVFERKGTSYQVEGVDLNKETTDRQRNRFSLAWNRQISWDVFKPWDSDDSLKVLQQVARGELGAVKWHARAFNMVYGDGRVITLRSKDQEKREKGETSDD